MDKRIFKSPELFASNFLYILDKERNKVKLVYNPIQLHYLKNRTQKDVILKSRQEGISTVIQAEFFRLAITKTVTTATLSHEDETTQKFRRMVNRFYDGLSTSIAELQGLDISKISEDEFEIWKKSNIPSRKYSNSRVATYPDFDSEAVIATAGNTNTGRGGTYSHVHGSEVAFWKDASTVMSGLMQGGNPKIILESTPNGAQGYFYELVMEILDGNKSWNLFFYEWWKDKSYKIDYVPHDFKLSDTPKYNAMSEIELVQKHNLTPNQILWRREKIKELKHLFIQEYPEDVLSCFLSSGNSYFGTLDQNFKIVPNSIDYNENNRYYGGLDFGQTNDYTVLVVLDKLNGCMVDMLRINGLSWGDIRARITQMTRKWNLVAIVAEKNSMGQTNIEALWDDFIENNIKTRIVSFVTTNKSKHEIMSDLHEALNENGLLLWDDVQVKREFRSFISKQTALGNWQLQASEGNHDDIVIATALSLNCMLKFSRRLAG